MQSGLGSKLGRIGKRRVANSKNLKVLSHEDMRQIQDRAYEGSMLDGYHAGAPYVAVVHGY